MKYCCQTGSLGESTFWPWVHEQHDQREPGQDNSGVCWWSPRWESCKMGSQVQGMGTAKTCMVLWQCWPQFGYIGQGRGLCSQQRYQLRSEMESRWMVGKRGENGCEAEGGTKGRLTTSKDITWDTGPAQCPSSWAFPQALHLTAVSPHFLENFCS